MKNLKSPFCWNICGMISKFNKRFKLAANSFNQALKFDGSNQTILREATNQFLLSRNFDKHLEMRKQMLQKKSNLKMNWCGVIVASHLSEQYDTALFCCNELMEITNTETKEKDKLKPAETSEIYIYKAFCLYDAKRHQENINYLKQNSKNILNKLFVHQIYVKSYFALGEFSKAEQHIRTLLLYLPENKEYIDMLCECEEQVYKRPKIETLENLLEKSETRLCIKMLLDACGPENSELFKKFFRHSYIKAMRNVNPSFFKEIKSLYDSEWKVKAIEEILMELNGRLKEGASLNSDDEPREQPTCLMYSYFILGHHYLKTKQYETALRSSEDCLNHTPTFLENYLLKAKIYKNQLKYKEAADTLVTLFNQDMADRFQANKASKYLVRDNRINEADQLFKKFMKDDKNNEKNLHDLQKMWYEQILGQAYIRQNKWKRGLRLLNYVAVHFNEIDEEQLDFFSFSLRKYSMKSFVEMVMLNMEDIQANVFYIKGHSHLVKYYMSWQRTEQLDQVRAENTQKGLKKAQLKKLEKDRQKIYKLNNTDVPEDIDTKLDLAGTKIKDDVKLPDIAAKLANVKPQNDKLRELAFGNLLDYHLDTGRFIHIYKTR